MVLHMGKDLYNHQHSARL